MFDIVSEAKTDTISLRDRQSLTVPFPSRLLLDPGFFTFERHIFRLLFIAINFYNWHLISHAKLCWPVFPVFCARSLQWTEAWSPVRSKPARAPFPTGSASCASLLLSRSNKLRTWSKSQSENQLPVAMGRSWRTSLKSWCWPSSWPWRHHCHWQCKCLSASCLTLHQAPSPAL